MHFPPQMLDRCLHILKHRGPRPLLRLADRLRIDLAQQKGVEAHLDYLRKRATLMQYPAFRQQGWPIGSGMVESANKNVVEARLKGAGMHWERKHVNSMLALRMAVCNDRWQEMWQKALVYHCRQQALQRSKRAKPEAQTSCCFDTSSSQQSSPPSAVASQPLAPAQSASMAEAAPLAAVPTATPSRCGRLSSRRKRQTARNRVKYAHPNSSGGNADVCPCGAPLVRFKGHRTKEYCSNRCRERCTP